jgi:hypothetical protein
MLTERLAERVARRFAALNREAKADPLWNQWLDEAHGGGKAKVPNPNPNTRAKYREVSFSTALKDDAFKAHALKQFEAWKGHHKNDTKPEKAPKTPEKLRQKKPAREGALDGGDVVFKHMSREKIHKEVETLTKEAHRAKGEYLERDGLDPWFVSHVKKMNDVDTFLHWRAGELGNHFVDHFLQTREQGLHKDLVNGWTDSATSEKAQTICAAVELLGFEGSLAPEDDKKEYENAKHKAERDEHLHTWMQKVHTFQQEVFKALGVKEVTLYRGVKESVKSNEGRKARSGDRVSINTRAISSYTSDPRVAARFGSVIQYKVPVEHILLSPLVAPHLASAASASSGFGEAEFVVMGASELEGTMTDIRKEIQNTKWAAEKPSAVLIPFSSENEDWIRTVRKQRQMVKKIARAYARSSGMSRGR